jgi:GLPGLI family protein
MAYSKSIAYTLSAIVCLMCTVVNAQTSKQLEELRYSLIYKLTMQIDSALSTKRSELTILRVGDSIHHFLGYAYNQMDSVLDARPSLDAVDALGATSIFFENNPLLNYKIYKNVKKLKYKHMENIVYTRYSYRDTLSVRWKTESIKDTIHGYVCQKATAHFAGRNYVAWFTMDLPLQAAPYKFDGLPGVIVKVNDTQEHYTFELVSIYKSTGKEYLYKQDHGARQVTRAEFLQQRHDIRNKTYFQLVLEDGGIEVIDPTSEDERAYGRKAEPLVPNYIELE